MDEQAPAATAELVPPSEVAPEAAAAPPPADATTAQIETATTDVDIAKKIAEAAGYPVINRVK